MVVYSLYIVIDGYSLSSEFVIHRINSLQIFQKRVSLFLEPSFKNFLDFQIILNNDRYWLFLFRFCKEEKTSKMLSNYPPNCDSFIYRVNYGIDLWVKFPKAGFPEEREKVRLMKYFVMLVEFSFRYWHYLKE